VAEHDYVLNMNDLGRTGLSLVFSSFKMVNTGTEISNPPTISELGRGLYTFAYDPYSQSQDISYVASDGTSSNILSGRIPIQAWSDYITLNFDDPSLIGLSLTFQELRRVDNNTALSAAELFLCTGQAGIVAPVITELGQGRYVFRFRNLLSSDVWFSVVAPGSWPFMTGVLQRDTSFDTTNGVTLGFLRRSARLEYDVPSGEHYTDEMLNKWVNDAYFEFVKKTNWLLTKKVISTPVTVPVTKRYQLTDADKYFRPVLLMGKKASGYAQDIKFQRVGRVEMEEAKKINMHRRFDGIYNIDRTTTPYTIEIFVIGDNGYERYSTLEFTYFRSPTSLTYDNDAYDIPPHYSRGLIAHVIHRIAAEDGDTAESQRQYGIFLEEVSDASKEINETNDPDHRDIMDLYTDEYDDEYSDRVAWS